MSCHGAGRWARTARHLLPPVVADAWRGDGRAAIPTLRENPARRRGAAAEDAVKVTGEDGRLALGVEVKLIERRALGVEHGVLPAAWKERGV